MKKVIVALSGGMDSTTVLAKLIHDGYVPHIVTFYYGSKHNFYELKSAEHIVDWYSKLPNTPLIIRTHFDLTQIFSPFKSNLLSNGGPIPEGHYTDKSMDLTVVPGRNMIFLTILAGLAWSMGARYIALGIHQGDHAIYPDCRKEFYKAADSMIYLGTDQQVEFLAPFLETDKQGILEWGYQHEVPYHLTRTCYKDQPIACGKCGSCVERLSAFHAIKKRDPIEYEDKEHFKKYLD